MWHVESLWRIYPVNPVPELSKRDPSECMVTPVSNQINLRNWNFLEILAILKYWLLRSIPSLLLIFKVFSHGHLATFQSMVLLVSLISIVSSVQRLGSWDKRWKSLQVADTARKSWAERREKIASFISSGRSMNLETSVPTSEALLLLDLTMFLFQHALHSLIDCCKRGRHVNLYCDVKLLDFFV